MKRNLTKWFTQSQGPGNRIDNEDKTFFGFLFKNLEVLLLVGMGFLIYAIYFSMVEYISNSATFIKDEEARFIFSTRLIAGLMFVEILLSLSTAYFRKNQEWFKSFLVTAGAFVIAYYNHLTINELFADFSTKMPTGATAVETKMLLANWFIFALGEVIGLLMHSKGSEGKEEIPQWFQQFTNMQSNMTLMGNSSTAPQPTAQAQGKPIGFEPSAKSTNQKPRGNQYSHERIRELYEKGLRTKEIATMLNCSEATVRRAKKARHFD